MISRKWLLVKQQQEVLQMMDEVTMKKYALQVQMNLLDAEQRALDCELERLMDEELTLIKED